MLAEIASFVCMWALLRLALDVKPWFPVATAQLAGNAFSRIVPGGAAAGGAMQFDMLRQAGIGTTWAATSVTAVSLISTATLLGLPVISIVVILVTGASVERNLFRVGLDRRAASAWRPSPAGRCCCSPTAPCSGWAA